MPKVQNGFRQPAGFGIKTSNQGLSLEILTAQSGFVKVWAH